MPVYVQQGIKELWVKAGVGDTIRYIPLHTLYQRLDASLCEVLPAVHSLTGCDITSKVGTKKAALTAEPQKFMKNFGKLPQLSSSMITRAEQYMIKVLKPKSTAKTFTELRGVPPQQNKLSAQPSSHQ